MTICVCDIGTDAGPSFADTIASVKDGSIFKDFNSIIGDIKSSVTDLGSMIAEPLNEAMDSVNEAINEAKAEFGKNLALARSSMELQAKELISQNIAPTLNDVKGAAEDMFKIFKEGPTFLADAKTAVESSITGAISSVSGAATSAFGLAVGATAADVKTAISGFAATIPPLEIPDPGFPSVLGIKIPNPAYAAFAAANSAQMAVVGAVQGAVQGAVDTVKGVAGPVVSGVQTWISEGFDTISSAAASAKASVISALKANSLVAQITAPANAVIADIKSAIVDATKVDILNIKKMAQQASSCDPTIPPVDKLVNGPPVEVDIVNKEPQAVPSGPTDLITGDNVRQYFADVVLPQEEYMNATKAILESTPDYQELLPLKEARAALINSKPDSSTWTVAEKQLVEDYNKQRDLVKTTPEYETYDSALIEYNAEIHRYKQYMVGGFTNGMSKSFIPKFMLDKLT